METAAALDVLRRLAEGIDPATGEVFEPDSPYQQPQVIRALFTAIEQLEKVQKRQARQKSLPARAGQPWDQTESDELLQQYKSGHTVKNLAQQHQRTPWAIRSQLEKLGIPLAVPQSVGFPNRSK